MVKVDVMKYFVSISGYYGLYGSEYTIYSLIQYAGYVSGNGIRFVITDSLRNMLDYMVDVNGNKVNN